MSVDVRRRRTLQGHIAQTYGQVFYVRPRGDGITRVSFISGGAGSFPDVPSRRMAWDADGSVALYQLSTDDGFTYAPVVEWGQGDMTEANDEDNVDTVLWAPAGNDARARLWVIFPELREFDGFFGRDNINNASRQFEAVDTSGDTTNGLDGTFTFQFNYFNGANIDVFAQYRNDITSAAVSNVRAVKIFYNLNGSSGGTVRAIHLYGEISASETPDRLLWIDNDDDLEFSKPIDYGDVPRGSAEDRITYLKNNSASLSADTVQVTAEDLYRGSGGWYTFDDGTGFSSTKALASSIGNGANSPDITIRRITPDAAALGLHAARAYVNVGSWT